MNDDEWIAKVLFPVVGSDESDSGALVGDALEYVTVHTWESPVVNGITIPEEAYERYQKELDKIVRRGRVGTREHSDKNYEIVVDFASTSSTAGGASLGGQSYSLSLVIADKLCRFTKYSQYKALPTIVSSALVGANGEIQKLDDKEDYMKRKLGVILRAFEPQDGNKPLLKPGDILYLSSDEKVDSNQIKKLEDKGLRVKRVGHLKEVACDLWEKCEPTWYWLIAGLLMLCIAGTSWWVNKERISDFWHNCDSVLLDTDSFIQCADWVERYHVNLEVFRWDAQAGRYSPGEPFSEDDPLKQKDKFLVRFDPPDTGSVNYWILLYSQADSEKKELIDSGKKELTDLVESQFCHQQSCGPLTLDDAHSDVLYFVVANKTGLDEQLRHLKSVFALYTPEQQRTEINQLIEQLDRNEGHWVRRIVLRMKQHFSGYPDAIEPSEAG